MIFELLYGAFFGYKPNWICGIDGERTHIRFINFGKNNDIFIDGGFWQINWSNCRELIKRI